MIKELRTYIDRLRETERQRKRALFSFWILFAWILYSFIERNHSQTKSRERKRDIEIIERERQREFVCVLTCVLFLVLDISENMAGSG